MADHSAPHVAPGESLASRLARFKSAKAGIEQLADDYHSALRPVREALQGVADVPLSDRDHWPNAVAALASVLTQHGLGDIPAALEKSERWNRQFDAGCTGNALAGQAFCATLAGAISAGSRTSGIFDVLDAHSFITSVDATDEVCRVLSKLMYDHTARSAPRFVDRFRELAREVGCTPFDVKGRLAQCGLALSAVATAAVDDWKECLSGMKYYQFGALRPAATADVSTSDVSGSGGTSDGILCYRWGWGAR